MPPRAAALPRAGEHAGPDGEEGVVCARCGGLVTFPRFAISVSGSHEHTFVNPAGIIYRLACYRSAPGCRELGDYTGEFSWFAGCTWRYAACASCREHLGWAYRADGGASFYGLIADRIVEGGLRRDGTPQAFR